MLFNEWDFLLNFVAIITNATMEEIRELNDFLPDFKDKNIGDYLDYQNIDLLEYVCEVANWFVINLENPDFFTSKAPAIFAYRYSDSKLATDEERYESYKMFYRFNGTFEEYQNSYSYRLRLNSSYKDKYLENNDLQNTIEAFGLDVSKFWYLLLFVHDYVEDLGIDAQEIGKTVFQDLQEFVASLSEATSIRLEKNNRKSYSTNNEKTIEFINKIVNLFHITPKNLTQLSTNVRDFFSFEIKGGYKMDRSHKKVKFAEIFQHFLKDRKAKTLPHKMVKVSRNKIMFISRLLYTVGYHDENYNKAFFEKNENGNGSDKDNTMLSNLLRKYRNEEFPKVVGRIYTI